MRWEASERAISSWEGGIGGILEVEGLGFGVWVSFVGLRVMGFLGGLELEGGWGLEPKQKKEEGRRKRRTHQRRRTDRRRTQLRRSIAVATQFHLVGVSYAAQVTTK